MCSNEFICFYDWVECRLIRRIDVNVKVSLPLVFFHPNHSPSIRLFCNLLLAGLQNLYWADSGDLLAIASDTSFYILKYNVCAVSCTFLHFFLYIFFGSNLKISKLVSGFFPLSLFFFFLPLMTYSCSYACIFGELVLLDRLKWFISTEGRCFFLYRKWEISR